MTRIRSRLSAVTAGDNGMRREVGLVGLLFISVGSIIGSGWLLGALGASETAGPASIISWVLGAAIVIVLALVYAELGTAYPNAGGTLRFPHFAFGSTAGFTAGWFAWIGTVTLAPIEVEAALQYLTGISWLDWLTHTSGGVAVLGGGGYAVAVVLLAGFTVVNYIGVRWFSTTNTWAVWWKIAVPLLTVIVLLAYGLHGSNFHAGGGFAPYGAKGVLAALPAGVIFAYQGFEQALQLGAESKDPARHVAPAVIGSVLIGVVLYVLLDIAFIGSLSPSHLVHGWSNPIGKGAFGPFASIATGLGITWLAVLLYRLVRFTRRYRSGLHGNQFQGALCAGPQSICSQPLRGPQSQRGPPGQSHHELRRRALAPPPFSGLATPSRLHHFGHRSHVRLRAAFPGCAARSGS
ncbi:MAG TPA: APC family permease [Acidimicrobiales bacterium]|nr:APC family permease [Acidimicrobiales bacterium]